MRTLHLLPTFHHDIAYLRRCDEYLPACEKIIDEALRILTLEPDYTFMIEQAFLLDWYWEKRPDQHNALKKFYTGGRLTIAPGMWTVPDLNLPDGESFLQQIRIGKEWIARHLGGEPAICWIADCWGHPPQMPQLVRLAGYSGYVFWRCMRPELQQADFVWRGLDGSTLPSRWMARGYANLRFPTEAEAVNAAELRFNSVNVASVEKLVGELDRYSAAGSSAHQLVCNGGDMAFPQSSAPGIIGRLRKAGYPAELRFSSLEAFFASRATSGLPEVGGEFNSALTGTFTSNIRLKLFNRACTQRLLALEKLAALSGLAEDFDPHWKLLLKQQFHDTICGTLADGALQDSLDEFAALQRMLDAVETRLVGSGAATAWFNACSFLRTVWLGDDTSPSLLDLPAHGSATSADARLLKGATGGPLPAEFVTPNYRARFDAQGFITSLVEASTGIECVDTSKTGGPFGALALVPDYGDLWLNHAGTLNGGSFQSSLTQNHPDPLARGSGEDFVIHGPFWPKITEVRVLFSGPDALVFEQHGTLSFWRQYVRFTTRVRLCSALPAIEYRTRFTPSGRDYRLRAAFGTPFNSPDAVTRFEVPFGVVARGAGEHAAQNFVDLRGPHAGLAVLNRGTAGHSVEDGAILMSAFRSVAMAYKAPSELSYGENVPHELNYAILPHAGEATAQLVQAGAAFNQQPIPLSDTASAYSIGDYTTDCPHVVVSSLRGAWPATDGVAVRLAETCGEKASVHLSVPAGTTGWAEADGLGRRTGGWNTLTGNAPWSGTLQPWQVLTVVFRKA
ncbi:MAG TPA: glycoside hydrolase family 38 C-terminal domain-containing protein [Rariglobus sp.]|nr:glycoside hydrolase family 38 C-terminal domain-containing protein [Rariglobus sp.]